MDNNTASSPDTAPPATVTPPSATPVLDALKKRLQDEDDTTKEVVQTCNDKVNALQAQLDAAKTTGQQLQAQVAAQSDTIDTLHQQLGEYAAIKSFLGL